MGRWRPPAQRSSAYITPAGAERLQQELTQLWKVERPQVTDAVSEAAKNGDRSENGDYIYGKKRLREIDRRVRYLSKRLDDLTVVHDLPKDQNKVFFGAWVTLEKEDGTEVSYQIVGPDEFDLSQGQISMDSPLAQLVLGKCVDDEVVLQKPEGEEAMYICEINYSPHTSGT